MALPTFQWMGNQAITSPEQAQRKRAVAEALMAQSATPAQNWSEGLADVAAALSGTVLEGRVSEAEAAGRERAGGLFAELAVNQDPNSIIAALTSQDAQWASPAQTSIASALLNSGLERADPLYQMNAEKARLELEALRNPTVDPWANTKIINDQVVGWGEEGPQPMADFRSPDNPLVTVNTGDNSGAFTKKGDELAATRLNTIIEGGNSAGQMIGDLQTLSAIGSQINTGKTAEIMTTLGPYAEAMGINIAGLGEAQAYKSIIDRMAPQMRPVGGGSSSDTDVRMFLNSLPSLGNTPQGNEIITQTFNALQQHKLAAAEIASQAFDGRKTWQEAEAEIRALPNPYEGFNQYKQTVGDGAPAAMPPGVTSITRLN